MKPFSLWKVYTISAIAATVIVGGTLWIQHRPPAPVFDGAHWSCPAGFDVYADESEALAGRNFVHCVKSN